MKKFKSVKKQNKFKRGLLTVVFTILPYIPTLVLFFVLNVLLSSKCYDITLKALAGIGLIFIAWCFWKISDKLFDIMDKHLAKKKETDKLDDSLEVEE